MHPDRTEGERCDFSLHALAVSQLDTSDLIDSLVDCLPYLGAVFIPRSVALGGTLAGSRLGQQAVLVDIEFRRSPDISRL